MMHRGAGPSLACFLALPFLSQGVRASDLFVPADHPTVQQAIDASISGDVICVDPGTYIENIAG